MKILVCSPLPGNAHRGNSVAAARLTVGFEQHGHTVRQLSSFETMDSDAVRAVATELKPDVFLILHAWRCATAFDCFRDAFSSPSVISLRGTDAYEMLDDPDRGPTVRRVLEACHAITVFHESMLEQLSSRSIQLRQKTLVIPNGLEVPNSQIDYRQRLGIPPEAFAFINVGGLRHVKRPLMLLECLSDLHRRFPHIHFLHAGPAIEADVAERFTVFEKANAWVHHVDAVPHGQVDSFLRAGDVYTSASRSEGMPHAVREAMAVGFPALLSDIPGHRSMADEGRQALFFEDADDFQRCAVQLIEDEARRAALGSSARRRICQELEVQDEIGSYLALFRRLVDEGGAWPWESSMLRQEHKTPHGTFVEYGPEPLLADHATRFMMDHIRIAPGSIVAEPGWVRRL